MAVVISFVLEKKGLTEGFIAMSFPQYYYAGLQENGAMKKKRSPGMGGYRMIEMVLLFLYRLMFGQLV